MLKLLFRNLTASFVETLKGIDVNEALNLDNLTHVHNEKRLREILEREFTRRENDLSVVMIDLDGLKKVNDTDGHEAGDALLRDFASLCDGFIRQNDGATFGRLHGDEFLFIFRANKWETEMAMIRVVAKVISHGFRMSYGICGKCDSTEEMLRLADERMYQDKSKRGLGRTSDTLVPIEASTV